MKSAIISLDGSGDFTTTMIATGKGNKIDVIDSVDFPLALAVLYFFHAVSWISALWR
jgi:carbamoyltransferase